MALATLTAIAAAGCASPRPADSPPPAGPEETGAMIAFHSDPGGRDDFYVVSPEGGDIGQLTFGQETVAFPFWSPDGSKIAYQCCSQGPQRLWVMNADGSEPLRLTDEPAGEPSWSPDGSRIAYVSHSDDSIWVVDVDGSAHRLLAEAAGGPAWSPDGSQIAYFSRRDFPGQDQLNEIYRMQSDGSQPTRLTDNEAEDITPQWAPDGQIIAFVSSRDGNAEIYAMRSDGSDQRRVTSDSSHDDAPSWSPDGSRILFVSYRDGADPLTLGQGNAEIFVVAPDGSSLANLTNDPGWDGYPAWSPDGSQIAFSTNNGVEFDLYVMAADGTDRRRLPEVDPGTRTANDCCPAWRP